MFFSVLSCVFLGLRQTLERELDISH